MPAENDRELHQKFTCELTSPDVLCLTSNNGKLHVVSSETAEIHNKRL